MDTNMPTTPISDTRAVKTNMPVDYTIEPQMCSGFGQFHTNEPDPTKPDKKLKPYISITLSGIRGMVDKPQTTAKQKAQWMIPSTLKSRTHSTQKEKGIFWYLCADIDKDTKPIIEVQKAIEGLGQHEIYTTSSATPDNQKCRILIPLLHPLDFETWLICQKILNDLLIKNEIIPDECNLKANQLCYLPNKGNFYDSLSERTGEVLDAKKAFATEIKDKLELAKEAKKSAEKKNKKLAIVGGSLIDAFNQKYEVGEILVCAEYKKKGNGYCHPESESKSYGATVKDGRVNSLNDGDPLCNGKAHDAFSAFTVLFHDGDENNALKDAGDNWVKTDSGEWWNKVKRRDWAQENALKNLHTMANNDADKQLVGMLKAITSIKKPDDFEVTINTVNLANAWNNSFHIQKGNTFGLLNRKGELVYFIEKDTLPAMHESFGFFIEGLPNNESDTQKEIKKKDAYRNAVKACLFTKIKSYRQRTKLSFEVDMFVDKSSITVGDDEKVLVTLPHIPFKVGDVIEERFIVDYKEHFPQFDEFLEVLCASRFAPDRREAFIWLHAVSGWGKGFLQAILTELGIVTAMSVKEIEKALEGSPLGRDVSDFLRSWILVVDEFKTVKSEIKELNNTITGSPKNQLSFQAPLYLKMFTSAETVSALVGEKGVEDQFAKRFSYIRPAPEDIDKRELFIQHKEKYFTTMANYVGAYLNAFVEEMRKRGKEDSASHCRGVISKFHKENGIEKYYGSIEDSIKEMAVSLKETLIEFAKHQTVFNSKLPKHLNELLMYNCVIGSHAKYGDVVLLKSPQKFIKDFIELSTERSQLYSMGLKAGIIAELANESEGVSTPIRLIGVVKVLKGVMVKIPVVHQSPHPEPQF